MRNKIYEFVVGVYPRRLWVTYDCDPAVLNDMFPGGRSDGTPFTKMDPTCNACVNVVRRYKPDQKGGVLIRFGKKSDMTLHVITHESVHAALEIFNYCDCRIDIDNQEPFAYLVEWVAGCCEQVRTGKFKD